MSTAIEYDEQRARKAWGALLADITAGGRAFSNRNTGVRMNTAHFQDSCGKGYDHEAGQHLTGRGQAWLHSQYHSGRHLGCSPSEFRSRNFK